MEETPELIEEAIQMPTLAERREALVTELQQWIVSTGDPTILEESRHRAVKAMQQKLSISAICLHLLVSERTIYRYLSQDPKAPVISDLLRFCRTERTARSVNAWLKRRYLKVVATLEDVRDWLNHLVSQGLLMAVIRGEKTVWRTEEGCLEDHQAITLYVPPETAVTETLVGSAAP